MVNTSDLRLFLREPTASRTVLTRAQEAARKARQAFGFRFGFLRCLPVFSAPCLKTTEPANPTARRRPLCSLVLVKSLESGRGNPLLCYFLPFPNCPSLSLHISRSSSLNKLSYSGFWPSLCRHFLVAKNYRRSKRQTHSICFVWGNISTGWILRTR